MDANAPRPRSRGQGLRSAQEQGNVVRKVFNCIVDDSALIQGAKKSTRDGIPKWVAAGSIRLFVPLFALDQTSRVKESKGRVANDAAEALQWLDDATSKHPDYVTLQGGFEQFETWAEVEKFAQPKTLFFEEDYVGGEDLTDVATRTEKMRLENSSEDIGQSFSSNESFVSESTAPSHRSLRSASPLSPPTSPPKKRIEPAMADTSDSTLAPGHDSAETSVSVRPLINYILWRVHEESNPVEALDSFIFLSDNQAMRKYAHRFGIRSKTLAEIRYVIARESQDARNRQAVQLKEASAVASNQGHGRNHSGDMSKSNGRPASRQNVLMKEKPDTNGGSVSDEDEILLKRAPKGPAALTKSPPQTRRIVEAAQTPRTPRGGLTGSVRGTPKSAARVAGRGRGGITPRGRGNAAQAQPSGPIDPDSFARPSPSRGSARGGRGLWMPT